MMLSYWTSFLITYIITIFYVVIYDFIFVMTIFIIIGSLVTIIPNLSFVLFFNRLSDFLIS